MLHEAHEHRYKLLMTVFAIMESHPQEELAGQIAAQFPNDHYRLARGQWLVSAKLTTVELSKSLGVVKGSGLGNTLVVSVSSYYGHTVLYCETSVLF